MRVLILTNQFYHFSGSEMVALEFAEELRRRNYSVHLASNEIGGELRQLLINCNVVPEDNIEAIDLFSFDLIISQHHLFPVVLFEAMKKRSGPPQKWPFLVFLHLSPYEPAEVPGPFIESQFADLILANSMETAQVLKEYGSAFDGVELFANPAPLEFSMEPVEPSEDLKSLLVVSNHRNKEIAEALKIVERSGVNVMYIGRKKVPKRVNAELLRKHDAVLTIGKTVQYALRAKRPVFCYDRFAGPGWLNSENFEKAAWFNFSGRDTQVQRDPKEIAGEILDGYRAARAFATSLVETELQHYKLENRVDEILDLARSSRKDTAWHRSRIELFSSLSTQTSIRHEARLASLYRMGFLNRRSRDKKRHRIKDIFRPFHTMMTRVSRVKRRTLGALSQNTIRRRNRN